MLVILALAPLGGRHVVAQQFVLLTAVGVLDGVDGLAARLCEQVRLREDEQTEVFIEREALASLAAEREDYRRHSQVKRGGCATGESP